MRISIPALFFCIVLLNKTNDLFAQQGITVAGNITAAGKAVEAASLSLLKTKDSSVVKLEISDKQGNFEFNNIKAGNYFLQADVVGYKKFFLPAFEVKDKNIRLDVSSLSAGVYFIKVVNSNKILNRQFVKL